MKIQRAWSWRGLGVALLLAVLAHGLAFKLANQSFSFSFQNPDSTAPLSTRLLEPAPVLIQPQAAAPKPPTPAAKPLPKPLNNAPRALAPADPIPANEPKPEPKLEPEIKPATEPDMAPKNEPNQPIAGIESAPDATDTIANPIASAIEPAPEGAITMNNPAAGVPAPPGVKLLYPPNAQLVFDGTNRRKGTSVSGSGLLSWKSDGSRYELTLEASALVILSQTEKSTGQLSPQGLAPERYSSSRTGRSEQATHFRRNLGKIQFSNNQPEEVLLLGAQDRISALVQLAGILGGDPERYKIVNRIQMQVAGLDRAEVWEFSLQGVSDITVPAANMQALKLTRTPRNEFDQKLELWLSPQLGYLPIRIRQSSATTPDQDFTDLVLRRLP